MGEGRRRAPNATSRPSRKVTLGDGEMGKFLVYLPLVRTVLTIR